MRFAKGLRQNGRFGLSRVLAMLGITAVSAVSTETALARTASTASRSAKTDASYPPAPDPRGPAGKRKPPAAAPAAPKASAVAPAAPKASAAAPAAAPAPAAPTPAVAPVPAPAAPPPAAPVAAPAPAVPAAAAPAPVAAPAAAAPAAQDPSGVATVPAQTPTEKQAARLSAEALGPLFKARRFPASEAKLREAIRICGPQECSTPFSARLHRDIGYLYVDGMKRVDDGKDEFTVALSMDPSVILTDSMLSLAVTQAFAETKKQVVKSEPKAEEVTLESEPETPKGSESEGEKDSSGRLDNWVSLSIQQDFVFHSQTSNACSSGSPYRCYDANGQYVTNTPDAFQAGSNQVSSGGAILATTRVLAGYDRVLTDNITVGARLGSVIRGKALRLTTDSPFLFFHGEARASYWFGDRPFANKGFRPYAFLSGGFGEADGKITVDLIYASNTSAVYKVAAWKRSGKTFVGPGIGLQWAMDKKGGPLAELRFLQFMGPSVPVIAIDVGYAIGF